MGTIDKTSIAVHRGRGGQRERAAVPEDLPQAVSIDIDELMRRKLLREKEEKGGEGGG